MTSGVADSPTHAPTHTRAATLLLLAVTTAWGSTFTLTRDLVATIPSADFLAVRFSIAAAVMVPLLWRSVRALPRRSLIAGLGLGALYGVAQLLQTVGLEHTSATRSGFLTGLYVILTPVLAAVGLRQRLRTETWVASSLAVIGLAILCLGSVGWGLGETLTLASAAVYAMHILGLGAISRGDTALGLSAVQVGAVAMISLIATGPRGIQLPHSPTQWGIVLYLALICGAFAMWAQTWGQAHMPATRAAIVMTTEPVFAAIFAIAWGGEHLTWRVVLGGALVLSAMYVVEIGPRLSQRRRRSAPPPEPPVESLHHDAGG
ncbi:hypothetical protein KEM60_02323 [Austwickia sp. TVS 96-490-7B]|uniref:DMT family transporter n=1 Tax=Austwickia sp. TVS 96-490-7B TaxID=2830843 RepID=UPI001C56FE52|nr:DMT family transporter [Austwickia sp. TVS 96-490-7B]MBW3086112.1 hypothetical protein [Austwickia sp. TVS 96-490-7B]